MPPMPDYDDATLTSPGCADPNAAQTLLCLTILWHPDPARIGEQCLLTDPLTALARYSPNFTSAENVTKPDAALPLGYGGISREPLHIRILQGAAGGVSIAPPASRMAVEVDGVEILQPLSLDAAAIERGVCIGLGRAVWLCLHLIDTLPRANALPGMVGIIGVGGAAIRLRDAIRRIARQDTGVLLLGETGTGKEVAAHALHEASTRAARKMVCVNMAALNPDLAAADLFGASKGAYTGAQANRTGYFAEAGDGSLFLDEIGNTPLPVQAMLLRVLEDGSYRALGASQDSHSQARLIFATDQDLYDGSFNPALLRRLESAVIHLPPLRARREDIGVLLLHFLGAATAKGEVNLSLPPPLLSAIFNDDWPGNIRQLAHVATRIAHALQQGEVPRAAELLEPPKKYALQSSAAKPSSAQRTETPTVKANLPPRRLSEISADEVLQAMQSSGGVVRTAAGILGISRFSMYKLLNLHPQIRRLETGE